MAPPGRAAGTDSDCKEALAGVNDLLATKMAGASHLVIMDPVQINI